MEEYEALPLRSGMRQRHLIPTTVRTYLQDSREVDKKEKAIRGIMPGEEELIPPHLRKASQDIWKTRGSMIQLKKTIKGFRKIARCKFKIQKSTAINTNHGQSEDILEKKTPIYNSNIKIKVGNKF